MYGNTELVGRNDIMDEKKDMYPTLEAIFKDHGLTDYKWIDPAQIVLAQWVRMKCMFGGCQLCEECTVERSLCKQPKLARPAAEGLAVDVYATVKKIGYPIPVRTDMTQAMDRYVFLMVH